MDYYLLPVEKDEIDRIEDSLKKIDYDVDDRAFIWSAEDIDKILSTMTEENAHRIVIDFLPEPVADKFAKLFGVKMN